MTDSFDLVIIGGGINGVGIARDAAGRGLSVLLCEQADLAAGTSSASSKLIHGGLRYLEYFEFRLVREALAEREVLLRIAPHIIRPLRFVLPHDRTLRPAWMLRAGLFLYDHLTWRRRLPGSRRVRLRHSDLGAPLAAHLRIGFAYSDCWVDDSRLVVLNALDAAERGAVVHTRRRCVSAERTGVQWQVTMRDDAGATHTARARALVNAAGPWVGTVTHEALGMQEGAGVLLVKGSHIVVPRLYAGEQAYILQNVDKRVVFILPFLGRFSLIGTTDVPYVGDPAAATITAEETTYLCEAVNRHLAQPISSADIVWSFAGVRPLYDDAQSDPSAVSREYELAVDAPPGTAPLLSVIGGKITAYRQVAEHALRLLAPHFPHLGAAWTAHAPLPGGSMAAERLEAYVERLTAAHDWLDAELAWRWVRAYGTRVERLLDDVADRDALGHHFGGGLFEREVQYLRAQEWARTAEDILWRRSKLGLFLTAAEQQGLAQWLAAHPAPTAATRHDTGPGPAQSSTAR